MERQLRHPELPTARSETLSGDPFSRPEIEFPDASLEGIADQRQQLRKEPRWTPRPKQRGKAPL